MFKDCVQVVGRHCRSLLDIEVTCPNTTSVDTFNFVYTYPVGHKQDCRLVYILLTKRSRRRTLPIAGRTYAVTMCENIPPIVVENYSSIFVFAYLLSV